MATEQPSGTVADPTPTRTTPRVSAPPEGPLRWRRRMPTSALGLALLLFAMSVASAFTGAVLYAYYEYRLGQTDDKVEAFQANFGSAVEEAVERIDEERDVAVGQVQSQLDDLERFSASGETLSGLLEEVSPSVFFVSTLDDAGQPSVGAAFVVFSDGEQSFLLTSFKTVQAATTQPVPEIRVSKGDDRLSATLTSWDPPNDLALLAVDRPSIPALGWAPTDPAIQIGDRVFVVSGLGAAGGSISQGFVAGVSAEGIQHDSPVGAAFQGGPLLNSSGQVVGVASRAYSPLGFAPEAVFFGVPVRTSCAKVLRCPDGQAQPG
ncbi:MAG: serine protease [Acidimicrobiales bacterium]|nr:serine protease [Acidimicrobiales bacterium]